MIEALTHWAAMGGYAGFVWPAYGLTLAVLGGLAAACWRRHRRSERGLSGLPRPGGAGQ